MSNRERKRKFKDYGIRPKGSPEVAYDPFILMQQIAASEAIDTESRERKRRVGVIFKFVMKEALRVLPPKQRKVFYSVWGRSEGNLGKGVMDFSRKVGQSHYTNYNNYYKAVKSVQAHLKKTGYEDRLIEYLQGKYSDDELELPKNETPSD